MVVVVFVVVERGWVAAGVVRLCVIGIRIRSQPKQAKRQHVMDDNPYSMLVVHVVIHVHGFIVIYFYSFVLGAYIFLYWLIFFFSFFW